MDRALAPGLLTHREPATQLRAPLTTSYARHVLGPLPSGAVLLAGTLSTSFPLSLAQADGFRTDVVVVAVDGLIVDWYRNQVEKRLGESLPKAGTTRGPGVAAELIAGDPGRFFLDAKAQENLAGAVAYRPTGLTAAVVPGSPPGYQSPPDPAQLVADVGQAAAVAGADSDRARGRWPNDEIVRAYARPVLLIAQDAINQGDLDLARKALLVAARLEPDNTEVRNVLDDLGPGG